MASVSVAAAAACARSFRDFNLQEYEIVNNKWKYAHVITIKCIILRICHFYIAGGLFKLLIVLNIDI